MKIKIELQIENCYECPFKKRVYEQGYSATDCTKTGIPYDTIPPKGIKKNCPFRKSEENADWI